MFNTTVAQNQAHRADLIWIKAGADYIRSDGYTLRKCQANGFWFLFDADGGKVLDKWGMQVRGHSLTWAKLAVQEMEEGW